MWINMTEKIVHKIIKVKSYISPSIMIIIFSGILLIAMAINNFIWANINHTFEICIDLILIGMTLWTLIKNKELFEPVEYDEIIHEVVKK